MKELHFDFGDPRPPSTMEEITRMESDLNTRLPASYVAFMLAYGGAYTPDVLGLIVDGELDMPEFHDITAIPESIRDTKAYWAAGTSRDLIGFGGDSGGNMFCFKRYPADAERPDDLPVWFFDQEFVESYEVSTSFDQWLLLYVRLKRPKVNE
jgi:hypothetical protein